MIELDTRPQVALVLHPQEQSTSSALAEYRMDEAVGLAVALELSVAHSEIVPLREAKAKAFFGSGKIEEMSGIIAANDVTVVVVNGALAPIQQRNLEKAWNTKVIDRTGLILEIFALRAATKEGRLQVELARTAYERSRLVRTWTHLERQRGGQGFLAGPGETQIESDRRMLAGRITKLKKQLEDVRRTRNLQRQKRKRAPERVVALVGYTNAGKSSLFNIVTKGNVLAKDMLFATLDTTHRILELPSGQSAVLSDTVGFISDLPTDLITAFRATLEEVREADLLLHVRDITDPMSDEHRADVMNILDSLEAGPEHNQPIIEVWNKMDTLSDPQREVLVERAVASREMDDRISSYAISCRTGEGLDRLMRGVEDTLSASDIVMNFSIGPADFKSRAWLHEYGDVLQEDADDDGTMHLRVRLSESDLGMARARHPQIF